MPPNSSSPSVRTTTRPISPIPLSITPESPFKQTMKALLRDGSYSDMTITCNGFIFKTHRAIVCTQSQFFKAALDGDFKEATLRTVDLPDDDHQTIQRVISFLYLQEYPESNNSVFWNLRTIVPSSTTGSTNDDEKKTKTANEGSNNVRVYVAADKFGIPLLKTLAAKNFTRWVETNWKSTEFPTVVEEVMATVPPHDLTLRNILADIISKNLKWFAVRPDFLAIIENFGGLGSAVIFKLVDSGLVKTPETKNLFSPSSSSFFGTTNVKTCKACNLPLTGFNIEYHNGTPRCVTCSGRN
ncbi:hypothetical protein MGYG_05113 [Nannizzia gypsea CBS 118893]|uniref:BTB domain-containing protein n=1 Tax=Arthroderma gypseum (strain ATCC MYA-4604 / CBS 118893) TaxID=535722 RepID=E4UYE8_ARTGP|nr:hypothetical protein MGYG_05113 [Nannizzia gypsea CBS 118893]EFR02111.1 hypothetical protein MGYG_05113 [Nannizzia gypsea CBS 118893]